MSKVSIPKDPPKPVYDQVWAGIENKRLAERVARESAKAMEEHGDDLAPGEFVPSQNERWGR